MIRRLLFIVVSAQLVLLSGCPNDAGSGGGGTATTFSEGFAFVRSDDGNVYVADKTDYTQVTKLTTNGSNRHPSLSKDARQVVFAHLEAGTYQLQTAPTSGQGPVRTVLVAGANQSGFRTPVFSPDGTFIVFAYDRASTGYLGRVNTDGSGFIELTPSTLSFSSPTFYPGGGFVLAIAGNGNYTQLAKVDVQSGTFTTVTNQLDARVLSIANRAAISSDGSKVAYDGRLASNSSAVRIFVYEVATGATHQLTSYTGADASAQDGFPSWTAADQVAFGSNIGGTDAVYVLPASSVETSGGLQLGSAVQPWHGP